MAWREYYINFVEKNSMWLGQLSSKVKVAYTQFSTAIDLIKEGQIYRKCFWKCLFVVLLLKFYGLDAI
jgi:hypothetical protein